MARVTATKRAHPHVFVEDPNLQDVAGGIQTCARCGLPAGNRIHQFPSRSEQERRLTSRRIGERD